jgi:hypothetical protein
MKLKTMATIGIASGLMFAGSVCQSVTHFFHGDAVGIASAFDSGDDEAIKKHSAETGGAGDSSTDSKPDASSGSSTGSSPGSGSSSDSGSGSSVSTTSSSKSGGSASMPKSSAPKPNTGDQEKPTVPSNKNYIKVEPGKM